MVKNEFEYFHQTSGHCIFYIKMIHLFQILATGELTTYTPPSVGKLQRFMAAIVPSKFF